MTNIELFNNASITLIIIPIVYYLVNYSKLVEINNSLFFYLLLSFLTELLNALNYYFIHSTSYTITLIFIIYEVLFFYHFYKKSHSKKLKLLLYLIIACIILLFFIDFFEIKEVKYDIFLGGSRIIILIICLSELLNSFDSKHPLWRRIIVIAFIQYAVLGVSVFSFASFFIENKQYLYFFVLINSISNALLYLTITYSLYLCKKKYLQALY